MVNSQLFDFPTWPVTRYGIVPGIPGRTDACPEIARRRARKGHQHATSHPLTAPRGDSWSPRLVALAALVAASSAPARIGAGVGVQAGHTCLVMTGSGDPAFVTQLQPVHGDGPAERHVRPGRVLRAADHHRLRAASSRSRGSPSSWKWTNGEQDAHAQHRQEREVVRRQAADGAGRRLQPDRRPPERDHGPDRPRRRRQQRRLDQGEGQVHRPDHAEDAGLAVHPGHPEPPVRRPAAHLVEGEERRDVH